MVLSEWTFYKSMILMRKDVREKMPSWVNETDGNNYQLCMSDDIDSLLSCKILENVKGYEINYFYSFDKFFVGDSDNRKQAIGVDISLMNGKCWDNHISMLSRRDSVNKQSANLNVLYKISRDNYTEKYAGSTLLQIWSYYNIPLPETDEGKMLLLAIDSAYKGHYIEKFRETQNAWLRILEFEELIELQERYTKKDFERISKKYKLNEKIIVNKDGYLETDLLLNEISEVLGYKLILPEIKFTLMKQFKNDRIDMMGKYIPNKSKLKGKVFSLALTGINNISYSTLGDD